MSRYQLGPGVLSGFVRSFFLCTFRGDYIHLAFIELRQYLLAYEHHLKDCFPPKAMPKRIIVGRTSILSSGGSVNSFFCFFTRE
jgi:hypothetical protein